MTCSQTLTNTITFCSTFPEIDSCLPKRPTSLAFPQAPSPESIVVADAFGDVYKLSLATAVDLSQDDRADSACILGHFSTITHVDMHASHIASADRDARVRISHWPEVYVIRSFCLGHSDVITDVTVLPDDQGVVSAAVDGTVRLWSLDGQLRQSLTVDFAMLTALDVCHESSNHPLKPPAIVALVAHPSNPDAALFVIYGANAVFQLNGLSRLALENVTVLVRRESPITGIAVDSVACSLWVSNINSCSAACYSLKKCDGQWNPEQPGTLIQLELSDKPISDESTKNIGKFQWLLKQRKKEMVSDWKGKKRRHIEI